MLHIVAVVVDEEYHRLVVVEHILLAVAEGLFGTHIVHSLGPEIGQVVLGNNNCWLKASKGYGSTLHTESQLYWYSDSCDILPTAH